ncbi:hypothetical protein CEXT_401001 [Caerostris extrusa]|uniref:LAGLIDADG homing endonuclease n=1 Tax=Caerostris extrusa TaxID=172846 RepID=A0AAV4UVW3_CAEEX|nr:hypothetical protein CEXT_401001 [Caerostris extrusa]
MDRKASRATGPNSGCHMDKIDETKILPPLSVPRKYFKFPKTIPQVREYLSSISAADVYWNSIDGKPRNISGEQYLIFGICSLRNPSKSGKSKTITSLQPPSWIQNATSDISRSGFRFPFLFLIPIDVFDCF